MQPNTNRRNRLLHITVSGGILALAAFEVTVTVAPDTVERLLAGRTTAVHIFRPMIPPAASSADESAEAQVAAAWAHSGFGGSLSVETQWCDMT